MRSLIENGWGDVGANPLDPQGRTRKGTDWGEHNNDDKHDNSNIDSNNNNNNDNSNTNTNNTHNNNNNNDNERNNQTNHAYRGTDKFQPLKSATI